MLRATTARRLLCATRIAQARALLLPACSARHAAAPEPTTPPRRALAGPAPSHCAVVNPGWGVDANGSTAICNTTQ